MGALLGLGRPASHIPEFLLYYAWAAVAHATASWCVVRNPPEAIGRRGLRWIWIAAVLFRLTLLPLGPSLSEDAARYRWQGLMQDAGGDPYVSVPEEPRWEGLRDSTWDRVSSKDKPSAYGPVVEQINLWHYRLVKLFRAGPELQVWLFKLPYALAELCAGLLLVSLLAAAGRPRSWVLVYLWCPLPMVEFWVEGHNDAVAVALVLAALAAHLRSRPAWALGLLAAAAMSKFWPVVLLPFLAIGRQGSRWRVHWRGLGVATGVGLVLCLPYWHSLPAVLTVLDGFAAGWRNNDSLFAALVWVAGGDSEVAATLGRTALVIFLAAVRASVPSGCKGELAAICALLLLSANCFPWYLSWMLPLVAVHPSAPLLLWAALAPLAYHVVPGYEIAGLWQYEPEIVLLEYAPVLAWLACSGVRALIGRANASPTRPVR